MAMTYQVLARKWRPRNFAEMVGQAHVVRALTNALEQQRLHHAYLFTGTRGVGKTTLARILAKSLNCEQGVTSTPCGECGACTAIDGGRFVDLLEVDAASRTKVDQTRELLEQVPYAPAGGRYKVYLIDEVHMFSDSSFNALLKTLEEPPPHVKFLLATTDPQKVPVTVLSRCLQFGLKRLSPDQIEAQLQQITAAESVASDPAALRTLAYAADGSMRDGLSLLDQAIAHGGGAVKEADVQAMLGVTARDSLPGLLRAVHGGAAENVLSQVNALSEQAPDFSGLLRDLLTLLHSVAVRQAVAGKLEDDTPQVKAAAELAASLLPEDVQLYYQIAQHGLRDLPLAPDERSGFEMVLLRMLAFRPASAATGGGQGKTESSAGVRTAPASDSGSKAPAPEKQSAITPGTVDFDEWHRVVAGLPLGGLAAQLASHCSCTSWDGQTLSLAVAAAHGGLLGSKAEENLRAALTDAAGADIKISFHVSAAENEAAQLETPAQRQAAEAEALRQTAISNMAGDPLVQALGETFGAELKEDSVRPLGDN